MSRGRARWVRHAAAIFAVGEMALAAALLAPRLLAQEDHPSHVPIPLPANYDPVRAFQDRLQQARLSVDLANLIKQLGRSGAIPNQEQLQNLLRANPQLAEMLKGSGDPQLRDLIGKAAIPLGLRPEDIQRKLENLTSPTPADKRASTPRLPPPPASERPRTDPAEDARKRELANEFAQWAEKFPRDRLPESLRNSPAVKDLFQRLTDGATDALNGAGGADGWDSQLARLETQWDNVRGWLPNEIPGSLRQIKVPDISRFAPNVRLPQLEFDPPQAPAFRRIGLENLEPGAVTNVLLCGFGIAVLAALIWRFSGSRFSSLSVGQKALGPWPLDPAQVASRDQLIQAFEYLSLLRCGEAARTWHHRAIAYSLGAAAPERRAAAESLAHLYEQARYAPAAWGEPDWSAARGPLTLLAGAG